jgi:hypothetical protein
MDVGGSWNVIRPGRWGWIADETGLPVAEAIADELVDAI